MPFVDHFVLSRFCITGMPGLVTKICTRSNVVRGPFHNDFLGSQFSDFAGNSSVQKLNKAQTKRVNITVIKYNLQVSTGSSVKIVLSFYCFLYRLTPTFFPVRGGRNMPSLPRSTDTIMCPIIQSRHHFRCCAPASNILGGTLLCPPLLCRRRRQRHRIHRYFSSK